MFARVPGNVRSLVFLGFRGHLDLGYGLPPVHMTLPGYDLSIGGSDEQPTLYTRI
jgi:hypothetical protein